MVKYRYKNKINIMKLFNNYKQIAITDARKQVLEIINAGISQVQPDKLMPTAVQYNQHINSLVVQNRSYDIISGRIFVVGGGKAAGLMAATLEQIIGPKYITAGAVNSIRDDYKTKKIKIIKAAHPLPDKRGVKGVEKMLKLKEKHNIGEKDLVICLVSGGGSALLPGPVAAISLSDKQQATDLLIKCGANIEEINTVRKHLSRVKGGQLGRHFAPAQVVTIIISDVINNDLDVIASGPTVPDMTTFKDAYLVLEKYNLVNKMPGEVRNYLESGCAGNEEENPKTLTNCDNFIIGDNATALEAMATQAKAMGLKPIVVSSEIAGGPVKVIERRAIDIISGQYRDYNILLYGGETTPALPARPGQGGRNQHLAALTMLALEDYNADWTMAAMATDGADFTRAAAGAIVDQNSLARARQKKLNAADYINKFTAHKLFKKLGQSLLVTGDTETNVGDIMVFFIGK